MSIDYVWARVKEAARDAALGERRLTRFQARAVIERLMQEAHVDPWPPAEVMDFFTNELLDMAQQQRPAGRT